MTGTAAPARRLRVGDPFPVDVLAGLATADGDPVPSTGGAGLTHLQLRRFAGCPICDLHLRAVGAALPRIEAAGLREVVVFHSSVGELRRYEADLPMTALADPDRTLYRAVGVEPSPRAFLDPRLWPRLPAVAAQGVRNLVRNRAAPMRPTGGELGRPVDVLLDGDGRVAAVRYGAHAGDQWSVDRLLAEAERVRSGDGGSDVA